MRRVRRAGGAVAGVALLALLGLAPIALAQVNAAAFDGRRAYRDLVDLVGLGPRVSGTPAANAARDLLQQRLRQAGWPPQLDDLDDGLETLLASQRGKRDDRIVVVTHYDTKRLPHVDIPGANDGASGPALLLELARALSSMQTQSEVWLVFFDGHEPLGHEVTESDGLRGSRALAREWERQGVLSNVRALLVVDQVADEQLNLQPGGESSPELTQALIPLARRAGVGLDTAKLYRFPNDHSPFRDRGLRPILTIVDYELGGAPAPGTIWHTTRDDLSATSEESLGRAGDLVLETVRMIDRTSAFDLPRRRLP